ncbi:MAG: hypothetical protein ACI87E_002688 [Mariniblastus sp.]|jgi:uncharacterized protein (TIGR03546 family)
MNFLNSAWTSFKGTIRGFDSPKQLALGVAFGMMLGLIPKDSLIPYAIGLIAILSSANLICVILAAFVCGWLSPMLDPVTHPIGLWILTFDPLESTWVAISSIPILSWTRFENTVVSGTTLLGLICALPTYMISRYCFQKFGASLFVILSNTRIARWFVGTSESQLQKS